MTSTLSSAPETEAKNSYRNWLESIFGAELVDEARALLPFAVDAGMNDGAHDWAHLARVGRNAMRIAAVEGGDVQVLMAAVLLHDSVAVEKNSPLRAQASQMAADKARQLLSARGWPPEAIDAVAHAIAAHSYSANIAPRTLEARILQDADRLDALGVIGAARCFYVGGRLARALYDPADPRAERRLLDDSRYTLDHFQNKLFKLAEGFQTAEGTRLARQREARLRQFYEDFLEEAGTA